MNNLEKFYNIAKINSSFAGFKSFIEHMKFNLKVENGKVEQPEGPKTALSEDDIYGPFGGHPLMEE